MPKQKLDDLQIRKRIKANLDIWNKTSWVYLFLMMVWLFVALLMPATPLIGGAQGAHINAFYQSYWSLKDVNGTMTNVVTHGLTPLGIATIVFFAVGAFISLVFLAFYFSQPGYIEYMRKGKQYQSNLFLWWIAYFLLFGAVITLFGLAMAPPYTQDLVATWAQSQNIQNVNNLWNSFVSSASSSTNAPTNLQASILNLANDLGLNINQVLDTTTTPTVGHISNAQLANLIYAINNTVLGNPYESQMQSLNYQWNSYLQSSVNATVAVPAALQALALKLAQELHINIDTLLGVTSTPSTFTSLQMANLVGAINQTSFDFPSGRLTIVWNFSQEDVLRAAGWYANVAIFGSVLSLIFVIPCIGYLGILSQSQERKDYRAAAKAMFQEYKKMQTERKELRKNKKALREQEDELLQNLEQIKVDNKHEDTVIEQLSQQELEEEMAKTNALREEIEHLRRQREQIEQQAAQNSKKPKGHRQPTRQKKQQISVPDEELEEIFKSLDID